MLPGVIRYKIKAMETPCRHLCPPARMMRRVPVLLALFLVLPPPALAGDDDPWLRIIIELEEEGSAVTHFHFHDQERVPDSLGALAAEEGEIGEADGGVLTLSFSARPLNDILPLLRLLPQDRSEIRVVIRIPPNLRGADLWDFQARLSTERLRQVRIEFGVPPGPVPHEPNPFKEQS